MSNQTNLIQEYKKQVDQRIQEQEERKKQGDIKFFKILAGQSGLIRVLPSPYDVDNEGKIIPLMTNLTIEEKIKRYFFREYGMHWNVDPNKENSWFVCPQLTYKQACPICEKAMEHMAYMKTDKHAKELYEHFRAKRTWGVNVVDMNNKKMGVQIYPHSWTVHTTMIDLFNDADIGDVTDIRTGFNLKLKRIGNDTQVRAEQKPSMIHPGYLKLRYDLHKCLRVRSYDELKAVLDGLDLDAIKPRPNTFQNNDRAQLPAAVPATEPTDELFADEPPLVEASTPAPIAPPAPAKVQTKPVPVTTPPVDDSWEPGSEDPAEAPEVSSAPDLVDESDEIDDFIKDAPGSK